jgi:putative restriction endonuclease
MTETSVRWTRPQLLLALRLYVRIPFGRQHSHNPDIVALAETMGRTPGSVAMKLNNLTSLDPSEQARGIKGLKGASTLDRQVFAEFLENPDEMAAECEVAWAAAHHPSAPSGSTNEGADIEFARVWSGETEGEVVRKVRLAQRFFRQSTLAVYQSRCCVSGLPIPELLVASHIVPWAKANPAQRVLPSNGLCLSRLYDGAFDRGLITIGEDLRVVLSSAIGERLADPAVSEAFGAISGQRIQIPEKYPPDPDALAYHREMVFTG